jgi:predicted O-methyltransferase YrrM
MPLERMLSRALLHTIAPSDDTLASVVRALRAPAAGDERWAELVEAALALRGRPCVDRPRNWGRFLYRLVRELDPDRCLAVGAGTFGSYIAAGLAANYQGRLVAIDRDGSALLDEIAVDERVIVRTGHVADELPVALDELGTVDLALIDGRRQCEPALEYFTALAGATAPGGLLILADLGDMAAAWREIRADPRVTGSMTVGSIGFVVLGGARTRHWRVPRLTVAE